MPDSLPDHRTLTDADAEAVAKALYRTVVGDFYNNLGRGAWSWVKKGLIALAFCVAIYGAAQGTKDLP